MAPSELILNPDGSVYHLHLLPEQLADTVLTVGDPDRVAAVSQYFDRIDTRVQKREFVTHTGELGGRRITVISTGIGTDNIDIVLNELDALAAIDLQKRALLPQKRQLRIIRIGTSGALQEDLSLDSFLASSHGLGLEGLLHFYDFQAGETEQALLDSLHRHVAFRQNQLRLKDQQHTYGTFPLPPYLASADTDLLELFAGPQMAQGISLTAAGFYAPQGRELRLSSRFKPAFINELLTWRGAEGQRITNLEMETAGIYGLAKLLGHQAISLNALLANRANGQFSEQPTKTVDRLIQFTLERLGR